MSVFIKKKKNEMKNDDVNPDLQTHGNEPNEEVKKLLTDLQANFSNEIKERRLVMRVAKIEKFKSSLLKNLTKFDVSFIDKKFIDF